jgi:hypothetical protein
MCSRVQNFFPFDFVLPTGDIWNMCESEIRIIKPDGSYVKDANGDNLRVPAITKIHTQYPKSGTAVMRALTPEDDYSSVEILVFGGVKAEHNCSWGQPEAFELASRLAFKQRITWEKRGDDWDYTFGPWEEEDMLIARAGLVSAFSGILASLIHCGPGDQLLSATHPYVPFTGLGAAAQRRCGDHERRANRLPRRHKDWWVGSSPCLSEHASSALCTGTACITASSQRPALLWLVCALHRRAPQQLPSLLAHAVST